MLGTVDLDDETLGGPEEVEPVRLGQQVPLVCVVPLPTLCPVVLRQRPLQCLLRRTVRAWQAGQRWICEDRAWSDSGSIGLGLGYEFCHVRGQRDPYLTDPVDGV